MKRPKTLLRRALGALVVTALALLAPGSARAHFDLQTPACWMSQDSLGLPEKLGPCGDEGGGTPTGIVTPFQPGQTITVTVNELIFHPGHYRIALSVNDRSELPPEPVVTPGATPCGTAAIESPPVFPVLADDVFDHTAPFSAPQSVQVTLPSNVTCTHCTLQIIEFMSDHALNVPGGCFYHHCADISIGVSSDGGAPADGGGPDASSGMDASSGSMGGAPSSSGCSCSVPARQAPPVPWLAGLLVGVAVVLRRACASLCQRRQRKLDGSRGFRRGSQAAR